MKLKNDMVKTKISVMFKEEQTILFDYDRELMEFVYRSEKIKTVSTEQYCNASILS